MKHRNSLRYLLTLIMAVVLNAISFTCLAADEPQWAPEYERRVGDETAAEVDRQYSRVDDPEAVKKLQKIADIIGLASYRPEVKYDVRLVRENEPGPTPEVNAFSLPGGIVYVTEGLLHDVQSDDELAGIIAHEIAHNVTFDGLNQAERAAKIFKGEMAAVIATVLIGGFDNPAWAQVMQAGQLVRQGILGGYSIQMETRADRNAVNFMTKTKYNPVGLLTFMERLAAEERRNPPIELGVFQTHPLSIERVQALSSQIEDAGVFINRRATTNWVKPVILDKQINGQSVKSVVYRDEVVFACNTPANGLDPVQRLERANQALVNVLSEGAEAFSFRTTQIKGKPALVAYDQVIFTVEAEDAALLGIPPTQIVNDAREAIRRALLKERLESLWQ